MCPVQKEEESRGGEKRVSANMLGKERGVYTPSLRRIAGYLGKKRGGVVLRKRGREKMRLN